MTCRHPDACKKRPDPRAKLCRGCALAAIQGTPERRAFYAEQMRARQAKRWDWLPTPEAKAEYLRLTQNQHVRAAEAKRIILEHYGQLAA